MTPSGIPDGDFEKTPLARRIGEVYWLRVRDTGLGQEQAAAIRGELDSKIAQCVNHFQRTAPDEVVQLEKALRRYDRLREAAGIDRRLLEEPSRLLPGILGHVQAVAEAVLGAIPALLGFLTGFIPYYATRAVVGRSSTSADGGPVLISKQWFVGALVFSAFYGGLVGLVAWLQYSTAASVALAVLLITTGPFTLAYARRMRTIVAHLGDRTASWFKLEAVARVREAQDELVGRLDVLRNRYREEVHGWDPLPAHFKRRSTWAALARVSAIGVATTGAVMFIMAYMDRPVQGLPLGTSPWEAIRASDPVGAQRDLLRDAEGVLQAARQLDLMQAGMADLRADFLRGERNFLTQQDHDETRALLVAYLDIRSALLKTIWLYRGDYTGVEIPADDPLEARAFLTAYTAAVILVEKAWLIFDTFNDDPTTREQLDRADLTWGIPAGTFSMLESSLSNRSVMAELQVAVHRFDAIRAAAGFPEEAPWGDLAARAALSRPAVDATLDEIGMRNLRRTFRQMARQIRDPVDELTPVISLTVSRFRFRERPPHQGLISSAQVDDLRAVLRPGDILIERRNWFISNTLLPGFWPHAALYLGSYEELLELGVTADPGTISAFQGQNERGHQFAVVEAIGEGVIYTSLEQSVGEADAVAVLRPLLSDEELRDALSRALSHWGKEYDFDFDFTTTDRLVCTELIFRTYDGILEIPPMDTIMGKPRIAAGDFVRMWADGRASGTPQLELVRFLNFDEPAGTSVEADAETLVATLDRSRFTLLNLN